MSVEENKALVRRFLEWWASGDVSIVDETATEDVVAHSGRDEVFSGREVFKKRLGGFIGFFTERKMEIEDLFGEGDRVAALYVWSGVTRNDRSVKLRNMAIYRIEGGRIAEEWEKQDTESLAKQTGG